MSLPSSLTSVNKRYEFACQVLGVPYSSDSEKILTAIRQKFSHARSERPDGLALIESGVLKWDGEVIYVCGDQQGWDVLIRSFDKAIASNRQVVLIIDDEGEVDLNDSVEGLNIDARERIRDAVRLAARTRGAITVYCDLVEALEGMKRDVG